MTGFIINLVIIHFFIKKQGFSFEKEKKIEKDNGIKPNKPFFSHQNFGNNSNTANKKIKKVDFLLSTLSPAFGPLRFAERKALPRRGGLGFASAHFFAPRLGGEEAKKSGKIEIHFFLSLHFERTFKNCKAKKVKKTFHF
jgi:hypothetical protein